MKGTCGSFSSHCVPLLVKALDYGSRYGEFQPGSTHQFSAIKEAEARRGATQSGVVLLRKCYA